MSSSWKKSTQFCGSNRLHFMEKGGGSAQGNKITAIGNVTENQIGFQKMQEEEFQCICLSLSFHLPWSPFSNRSVPRALSSLPSNPSADTSKPGAVLTLWRLTLQEWRREGVEGSHAARRLAWGGGRLGSSAPKLHFLILQHFRDGV